MSDERLTLETDDVEWLACQGEGDSTLIAYVGLYRVFLGHDGECWSWRLDLLGEGDPIEQVDGANGLVSGSLGKAQARAVEFARLLSGFVDGEAGIGCDCGSKVAFTAQGVGTCTKCGAAWAPLGPSAEDLAAALQHEKPGLAAEVARLAPEQLDALRTMLGRKASRWPTIDEVIAYDDGREHPASDEVRAALRRIWDKPHRAPLVLADLVDVGNRERFEAYETTMHEVHEFAAHCLRSVIKHGPATTEEIELRAAEHEKIANGFSEAPESPTATSSPTTPDAPGWWFGRKRRSDGLHRSQPHEVVWALSGDDGSKFVVIDGGLHRPLSDYEWGGACLQGSANRWATEARDAGRDARALQARLATISSSVAAQAESLSHQMTADAAAVRLHVQALQAAVEAARTPE